MPATEMAMGTSAEPESPVEVEETATTSMEMTGTLFPEPTVEERAFSEEQGFTEEMADVEIEEPAESATIAETPDGPWDVAEADMVEHATVGEPVAAREPTEAEPAPPGSTSRAEWVEHVAQMEDVPAGARFDAGSQTLPPDAETVGWASDAVGWVTGNRRETHNCSGRSGI